MLRKPRVLLSLHMNLPKGQWNPMAVYAHSVEGMR
uniref:Uncharacterized protein n=1 Tax=Anguilla anguilla TaxID=7936 RepID=A0A0E9VMP3_ANGAN